MGAYSLTRCLTNAYFQNLATLNLVENPPDSPTLGLGLGPGPLVVSVHLPRHHG
ncbi:hypothetical protein SAMD00023353_5300770 [Rosellinia necatrix]|uniref:Uncharacterized protein n=1 Tax=Rosellinia necatrix TaxID=77044 RepID=A0A1S8AA93_ROSNE|nr:hypothetical protein SAMD00023353_5300770 [Rosellinia necatrix]